MLTKLIPTILKLAVIGAIIYGIYVCFEQWPVETTIVIGAIATFIIIYWLIELENE